MPNLDFYAVGADHRAVLDEVFGLGVFRVFEAYSGPDEQLREFTAPDELPAAQVQQFLMLYVIGSGPEPVARRIDLRPGNILGDATFRYECDGWGLIQLELGSLVDDSELRRSHTNHNTEQRARKWAQTAPEAGDPGQWDWALIARTSNKLNRLVQGMAVRKFGPWPVLPEAMELIIDTGLRYVYGLGIHLSPSPGMRGEVTRLAREAVRPPGTSFPGGADDAEIDDLQQAVTLPLPADLVDWLRACKGDLIGPGGLYGVRHSPNDTEDIASALDLFPNWRDRGWLPVAGDGNGDYYVLITTSELTGCIGFVDQADFDAIDYIVATNLWTFLWFLLRKDAGDRRWPFDRNHVVGHDPAMATIPADLQPWAGRCASDTTV